MHRLIEFAKWWRFSELQANLAVAAHLAHVSYAGQRD